ncbi:MAG: hypothetical protein KGZ84_02245 [Erysipelotrichia bacterium]|jgi:hypothetical protein|nr:hypothetical protein [Erysipelotrichia bacterium]
MIRHFKIIVFGLILLGLGVLFFDAPPMNTLLVSIISFPLTILIKLLRFLSLSNPILNIVAWLIFIIIGLIPPLIYFLFVPKQKRIYNLMLSFLFSLFFYGSVYGVLNYSFVKPMMPYENIEPVLLFSMSIILISLILVNLLISNLHHFVNSNSSFKLLQLILLISSFVMALTLFLPYASLFKNWDGSLDHFMQFYHLVFNSWLTLLLIFIFKRIIDLIDVIKIKTFSNECIPYLKTLQSSSLMLFFSSLGGPLFFGIVSFSLYQSLNHVNISIQFPWFEMILAILVITLSTVLTAGVETTQENEGFI